LEIVKILIGITFKHSKKIKLWRMCKSFWLSGPGYVNKQLYLTPLFFKDIFGRDIETLWFNDDACYW
jgi:hypothetical protein